MTPARGLLPLLWLAAAADSMRVLRNTLELTSERQVRCGQDLVECVQAKGCHTGLGAVTLALL